MQVFVPAMGRRYAKERNFDHGPGRTKAVSMLSPFVRRRLVSEKELVAAALEAHGAENAAKFIEEVIWRSYFKGWLERQRLFLHSGSPHAMVSRLAKPSGAPSSPNGVSTSMNVSG